MGLSGKLVSTTIKKIVSSVSTQFLGDFVGKKVSKDIYEKWFSETGKKFEDLIKKNPKAYQAIEGTLKGYYGVKKWYRFFSSPMTIQKFLKLIPEYQVIEFDEELTKVNAIWRRKDKINVPTSKRVIDQDKYNELQQQQKDELEGNGKWVELSSSWIRRGKWNATNKNKVLGNLFIETKTSDTIYVYPVVPYEVWVFMKNANGFNGGGAGTAFWRYWLREWYPSHLRAKINHDLKKGLISRNDHLDIWSEYVGKSAKSFYRSKKSELPTNLNRNWYQGRSQKGYLTYVKRSERLLNKANSTTTIYGSKMVYETYRDKQGKLHYEGYLDVTIDKKTVHRKVKQYSVYGERKWQQRAMKKQLTQGWNQGRRTNQQLKKDFKKKLKK